MLGEEDFENIDPGKAVTLLPEGVYPAKWVSMEFRIYSFGEKLVFRWDIFTAGNLSPSVTLESYYNVRRNEAGRLIFGYRHAFRQDWIAANKGKWPANPQKLPLSIWKDRAFLVEVVTIRRGMRGELPRSAFHSRVRRVIRPVEPGESFETLPLEPLNNSQKT